MSGFPLYDNLIQKLSKKDLTVKEKEQFIKNIEEIDSNGRELIYALIMIYHSQNDEIKVKIPYNGINIQTNIKSLNNITWNYMDFPIKLRNLLYKFICLHIKTFKEDNTRLSE
jgi:hypothetical protein